MLRFMKVYVIKSVFFGRKVFFDVDINKFLNLLRFYIFICLVFYCEDYKKGKRFLWFVGV